MSEQERRSSSTRRKRPWGCVGVIALCVVLAYVHWLMWGYVPLSTLPVEVYPKNYSVDQSCPEMLLPPPLPYRSPNDEYYIDLLESRYRDAWVVTLIKSSNSQVIGTYSYRSVVVYCWAQDNSGIYLADYVSGSIFNIGPNFPLSPGVIKKQKILVPCQSSLEGVPLFSRLYWGLRCALPGSEYSPFAVWFPLAVLLLGLGGVVIGVRELWRRWIRAW